MCLWGACLNLLEAMKDHRLELTTKKNMERNFLYWVFLHFAQLELDCLQGMENTSICRCLRRTLESSKLNVIGNMYLGNYINLSHIPISHLDNSKDLLDIHLIFNQYFENYKLTFNTPFLICNFWKLLELLVCLWHNKFGEHLCRLIISVDEL